jgi:hypothetical protein
MRRLFLVLGLILCAIANASSQTSGRVYRVAIVVPSGPISDLSETGRLQVGRISLARLQEKRQDGLVLTLGEHCLTALLMRLSTAGCSLPWLKNARTPFW